MTTVVDDGKGTMRYRLGRFLQVLGMLILPAGVAGNLARPEQITVGTSLTVAVIGAMLFYAGWMIQGDAAP